MCGLSRARPDVSPAWWLGGPNCAVEYTSRAAARAGPRSRTKAGPQMNSPALSIVVLSYNRLADIQANLPVLATWVKENASELIVVDNNSSDGSASFIETFASEHPEVTAVLNKTNRGVAGGRNDGMARTSGAIVLFLDDDSAPETRFLDELPALFRAYPEAGLITPRIIQTSTGNYENGHGDEPCWVGNFHGSCYAVQRSVIDAIGGFDEGCTFGGEELDYSIRAHDVGMKCLYYPDYTSHHNSIVRTGKQTDFGRLEKWFYNYGRVLAKNFPDGMALRLTHNYSRSNAMRLAAKGQHKAARVVLQSAQKGFRVGQADSKKVKSATAEFYNSAALRPEFGNVSVATKLLEKLKIRPAPKPLVVERRELS